MNEEEKSVPSPGPLPCGCFPDVDARACIELQRYGRTPVMRRGDSHSEAAWLAVDMEQDEACVCWCHGEDKHDDCDF